MEYLLPTIVFPQNKIFISFRLGNENVYSLIKKSMNQFRNECQFSKLTDFPLSD